MSATAQPERRSTLMRGSFLLLAFGLMGCPSVDLGETPIAPGSCRPDPAYFQDVIWPEFVAPADPALSCIVESGCHDVSNNAKSSLQFLTETPIDFQTNYDIMTGFLNCANPEASRAFTKPVSGVIPHGGEELFEPGSPSAVTFLQWFDL